MMARFNWQEEKEDGARPWSYDGSSSMREKPQSRGQKWLRRLRRLAYLGLCLGALFLVGRLVYRAEKVSAVGELEPLHLEETHIKASLEGVIEELAVVEGDFVEEGDLLALLQPEKLEFVRDVENRRLEVARLRRELEQAGQYLFLLATRREELKEEAQLLEERSELAALEARISGLELERDQARRNLDRARSLHEESVISSAEYEQVLTDFEVITTRKVSLEAELGALDNSRRLARQRLDREIKVLEQEIVLAEMEQAQLAMEKNYQEDMLFSAEKRAAGAVIRAPWSGRVVQCHKNAGDLVTGGETILMLVPGDYRRVTARVKPEDSFKVVPGQQALIYSRSFSTFRHGYGTGRVVSVGNYIRSHSGPGLTRYVPVLIEVENIPYFLPFGSSVQVVIITGQRKPLFSLERTEKR